jgi:hypothetical protein
VVNAAAAFQVGVPPVLGCLRAFSRGLPRALWPQRASNTTRAPCGTQGVPHSGAPAACCSVSDVEACLEGLYDDDIAPRAEAAARIAALFADARNLVVQAEACGGRAAPARRDQTWTTERGAHNPPALLTPQVLQAHASLLPSLARLLREDGRRSLELSASVAAVFFALSCDRQLHRTIGELQVGALLLELCQLEVQRTAQRIANEGRGATPGALSVRLAAAAAGRGAPLSEQ